MGKRELIALRNLSSWCLVMVGRLFLAVPRGCVQFVIVVFPDHTHYYFWLRNKKIVFQYTLIPGGCLYSVVADRGFILTYYFCFVCKLSVKVSEPLSVRFSQSCQLVASKIELRK